MAGFGQSPQGGSRLSAQLKGRRSGFCSELCARIAPEHRCRLKIIIHMGQGKTGTTALQESLHAASGSLSAAKVLYPGFCDGVAHHLLLALYGDQKVLPPWTHERLGGIDGTVRKAKSVWAKTCVEIERSRPELLVLSSEYLINDNVSATRAKLGAHLAEFSTDITPVVYIRHPVDHFRSQLQQWLKHRNGPCLPLGGGIKASILDTEAAFSRRPQIVAFDRQSLHGGDVIEDFATRFLAPWVQPSDLPRIQTNVGLSAEALVLMVQMRAELGGTYEAACQVSRLVGHLEALDRSDPPEQPLTLLPEVAQAALRSATGIRWLVDTGQVQLSNLDIDKIDGAPPPEWMQKAPAETLFLHDADRLKRLRSAVDQILAQEKIGKHPIKRMRTLAPSTGRTPKASIRGRLMQRLLVKLAALQRP